MSPAKSWPQDRLKRFWALQKRARKVGLRLTAENIGKGLAKQIMLRLRGDDRNELVVDLVEAETLIALAEKPGVAR
ncbi:MAG: hypothetical protein ABIQ30_10175 [Devosia sp.]